MDSAEVTDTNDTNDTNDADETSGMNAVSGANQDAPGRAIAARRARAPQRPSYLRDDARSPLIRVADQAVGPISRGARNVLRSPVRLALVAAILGISLMFVATMVALNGDAQQRLAAARAQIGTGIDIRPAGSGPGGDTGQYITAAQIKTVENTLGVNSVSEFFTTRDTSGDLKGSVTIPAGAQIFTGGNGGAVGNGTIPPSIDGILPGALTLDSGVTAKLKSGSALTSADANADVALMSQAMATANKLSVGSTFKLNGTTLKLIGIFTTGDSFDDNTVILPLQTAQRIYKVNGVTRLTAYADSDSDVSAVVSRLQKALGSGLDVVSQSQAYTDTLNALRSAQQTIQTTLIIAAITSALIIIFAVILIVRERTQEIGLLRAIGASHVQIVSQFVVETLTLGVAAAIAATILVALFAGTIAKQFAYSSAPAGFQPGRVFTRRPVGSGAFGGAPPTGGGRVFSQLGAAASHTLSAGLTPTTLLIVFALGVGLAIVASAIPAWYVARVRPAEALRQL